MKKTFISDLKKFNRELGEYISSLINNECINKPENINELLYSFFLGRMLSVDDVNLILENTCKSIKEVLTDYINFFKNNIKIDITNTLLESFNKENIFKTKELTNEKNINIKEESILDFIQNLILIRKKVLSTFNFDSQKSSELAEANNLLCELYNQILENNFNYSRNKDEFINDFILIFEDLVNAYFYFDEAELKDLKDELEIRLNNITKEYLYNRSLDCIASYYSPLTRDKLDSLIENNVIDSIIYEDFLDLLFSKIDYSLFLNKEEEIKSVINHLSRIYNTLANVEIDNLKVNYKEKEFYYKLLTINFVKKFTFLSTNDILNFVENFYNYSELEKSFYEFFDKFIIKFNVLIDNKLSDLFTYLIELYNGANDFYLSKEKININSLDGQIVKDILIKYLKLDYIYETLSVKSDNLGLSERKKDNKHVHKKFKMLTKEIDEKIDALNKAKVSNSIIESNLYLFYDYYVSLNNILKSRSKISIIKDIRNVRCEKKYINNFISMLANALSIEPDFLNNKFVSGNIENEIILNLKKREHDKFKIMNDELLKLKLSNVLDYKYNIVD